MSTTKEIKQLLEKRNKKLDAISEEIKAFEALIKNIPEMPIFDYVPFEEIYRAKHHKKVRLMWRSYRNGFIRRPLIESPYESRLEWSKHLETCKKRIVDELADRYERDL